MTTVPKRSFATAPFLVGTLFLVCALTFYYFSVLRIDYSKTNLLDLGPYTDAVEYFAQAKGLLTEGRPQLQIGYDKLPPKVPFGYPALMLPWLKILPEKHAVLAPFRTNQTLGLLLLLAVFVFYTYLAMPLTGGFAALLLATLPSFFTFCRSSMSDISASMLFVLAFVFAYLGLKEERRWKIYLSAAFLGLSLNIRPQSIFLSPLLLAMALFPGKIAAARWFLHCIAVLLVFALAASTVLIFNALQFHSPFRTGYYFWVPSLIEKHMLFSFHNIPTNAATLWAECTLRPKPSFNVANIFGTGTFFVPAYVLLICSGFFLIRVDRFVVCALLAGFTFFAFTATVIFGDGRLYLPLLILLVAVAVLPVTWAAKNLFAGKRIIAALAIFVLFAAACLGYPSRSCYKTVEIGRLQAWDALHFTPPPRQSIWFIAQRHFFELVGGQPGIVLSDIDPVYLNALLPEPFVAAPIDAKHQFCFSKIWRYGHPQALALVKKGLDESIPVYALFVSRKEMAENVRRLPELDGHQWAIVESGQQAVVLRLVPAAAAGN